MQPNKKQNWVFVLNGDKQPLDMVYPARARVMVMIMHSEMFKFTTTYSDKTLFSDQSDIKSETRFSS
jgi:hypothetical protein